MKNLKLFENAADYTVAEDIQVSYIVETDEVKYDRKKVFSLSNVKIGDNLKGATVVFDTSVRPENPSGVLQLNIPNSGNSVARLTLDGTMAFTHKRPSDTSTTNTALWAPGKPTDNGWMASQFVVPSDVDYIVTENTMVNIPKAEVIIPERKPVIKLTDLKVGDNVGGMKLYVANKSYPETLVNLTSTYPRFTAAGQNTKVELYSLTSLTFNTVIDGSSSITDFYMPRPEFAGGPYFNDSVITIPEGAVVTVIDLPVHPDETSWGFDYMDMRGRV